VVRELRARDHAAYLALLDASGLPAKVRGRDRRAEFVRQLRSSRTTYLGAFDAGRLVGVVLGTHDTRKGWINRLAVHPDYRRRGVASRLVRACERRLRALGLEMFAALIDTDNPASERLFRSLGYETMSMTYVRRKIRGDA
jgi:ribosomal protein S18 acetylase RimI-like enzyme